MMTNKKIPLRTCIVTKEKLPKQRLIRIVRTPEGTIEIDKSGKRSGRGAYIKLDATTLQQARKTKQLERHLCTAIPETLYKALGRLVTDATTTST